MNQGVWKGERLLSEAWIRQATAPSVPNPNYGYMWWLNRKGEEHWEGLPEHLFYAAGFGGNFIVIDTEKNWVLVTRWLEPSKIGALVKQVYEAMD